MFKEHLFIRHSYKNGTTIHERNKNRPHDSYNGDESKITLTHRNTDGRIDRELEADAEADAEAEIEMHQTSTLCNVNSPYLFILEVSSCDVIQLCDQGSTFGIIAAVEDAHKDVLVLVVDVVVLQESQQQPQDVSNQ